MAAKSQLCYRMQEEKKNLQGPSSMVTGHNQSPSPLKILSDGRSPMQVTYDRIIGGVHCPMPVTYARIIGERAVLCLSLMLVS